MPFPFSINSQRYNNTTITIYTFKIPDFEEDTRCQYLLQNHYFHNVDIWKIYFRVNTLHFKLKMQENNLPIFTSNTVSKRKSYLGVNTHIDKRLLVFHIVFQFHTTTTGLINNNRIKRSLRERSSGGGGGMSRNSGG